MIIEEAHRFQKLSLVRWLKICSSICLAMTSMPTFSQEPDSLTFNTLKRLSLEELMNIEVTSVSKRPEKLMETASAIQVITNDDIRRSGASSLPEALRLADNIQIGQKNAHDWAITTRGFNTDLSNKLLVLIDGRTVYTPLFSGVFWDRQDYLLEDIERIEVISGPGGTLWGSNAVNGVINIVTKKAADSQGLYMEAGGGTELRNFAGARYGSKMGSNVSFRAYVKHFNRDDAVLSGGEEASDSWWMGQGGFRMEAWSSQQDLFTLQGDYYQGDVNLSTGGKSNVSGNNLLGRWSRTFSPDARMSLQVYYDRTYLDLPVPESRTEDNSIVLAPAGTLKDNLNTYDIDFQHNFRFGKSNRVVWGFGYRHTQDEVDSAPGLAFSPSNLYRNLYSLFAQDEIRLLKNFFFTLGTKVEHNDYTGFEYEPSVRIQMNITPKQILWGSVSRAVRIPSRIDRHLSLPTPGFAPVVNNILIGGANFRSETVIAYEIGYRAQVGSKVSTSVSTFYNVYDKIRSTSQSPPDAFGLTFPFYYENNLEGETYGVEINLTYQVFDWWRLRPGYNLLQDDIRVKPGKSDFNNALNETADPPQRFSMRSTMDIKNVELEVGFRWVDAFQFNRTGTRSSVPAYSEAQIRLGWRPTKKIEISVVGQNLLHNHHLEYVISSPNPRAEIQRGVYAKLVYRY